MIVDREAVLHSILALWNSPKTVEWECLVYVVGTNNLADFLYRSLILIVLSKIVQ